MTRLKTFLAAALLATGMEAGAQNFDDYFVEPAFRGQGIARKLAQAAQAWCREQGCASLLVGCSPGDLPLYRVLGFTAELGTMLAAMTE